MLVITVVVFLISCGVCQGQGPSPQTPQTYPVEEDTQPPLRVINVAQVGGLLQKYPNDFNNLEYEFLPSSSKHRTYFRIVGGELETTQIIDRDVICPHLRTCLISLDIRAQLLSQNILEIIPITVTVQDKNDHVPTFPVGQIERSLSESSAPGTAIRLTPAEDPDSPRYGINRYELISSSTTFELKLTNNSDETVDIQLVLKELLDREQSEMYQMELRAYDGGTPPQAGAVTITINVKDNNDNNPVFDNKTYEAYTVENVPLFTTIIRVHAKDPDAGPNGEVVYSFTPRTASSYGHLFEIDQATGEIFLTKRLDYEEGDTYTLDVMASDKNPDPLTAVAKVIVHVKDLNDHAPQIMINSDSRDTVEISELAQVGTFVAHITVRDPDGGDNGRFNCSLQHDGHFQLQKIYKTEFKIITLMSFDREVESTYNPSLTCQDYGVPPQTQTLHIKVIVKDENDHAPEFSKKVYSTSMAENNQVGVFVIQVNATDKDQGPNADVRFTILGDAANMFDIDHISGNITARVRLDYEKLNSEGRTSLDVRVLGQDSGSPPQSATAIVKITIIDEDDVPPQFTKTSYIFGVRENLNTNTYVGQVAAEDPDSHPKDQFTFGIDSRYNTENAFRINPNSGKLYTRKMLDRELNGVYHLVVMATSTGSPDQTNTTNVFISVLDDNDNSPIVDFPTPLNNTVYVSQDVPVGHVITRIQARDADTGDNAKLTYNITASDEGNTFAMNLYTGAVLVASSLKEIDEHNRYFTLFISVHDNGNPVRFYETLLNIVVNKSAVDHADPLISNYNLTIVISIATVSGLVMVILLVAIVFIVLSQRRKGRKKYNYMPRMVDQKLMADRAAKDTGPGGARAEKVENKSKMNIGKSGAGSPHKANGKLNTSFDIERDSPPYEVSTLVSFHVKFQ